MLMAWLMLGTSFRWPKFKGGICLEFVGFYMDYCKFQRGAAQGPQRLDELAGGRQGLPGGATAPYASVRPPTPKLPEVVQVCQEVQLDSKKFSPLRR